MYFKDCAYFLLLHVPGEATSDRGDSSRHCTGFFPLWESKVSQDFASTIYANCANFSYLSHMIIVQLDNCTWPNKKDQSEHELEVLTFNWVKSILTYTECMPSF